MLAPIAASADQSPGGQGTLEHQNICFDVKSNTVLRICGAYRIHWKLWTLMGEPVGNYQMTWSLTTIRLRHFPRGSFDYLKDSLPPELKKAASAIELYINGYARVNQDSSIFHRFNTGVAVRAGKDASYNVPGSPSWDETFFTSSQGICALKVPKNDGLPEKEAKKLFIQGVSLSGVTPCPNSGFTGFDALERAIDKLCEQSEANRRPAFCPRQEKRDSVQSSASNNMKQSPGLGAAALDGAGQPAQTQSMVHDLLDEKAERPQVQKRLAQEIASYRNMATTTCQGIMRDIGACYANTPCTRPSPSPSSEQCKRIPAYPRGQCEPFCLTATIKRKPGDVCYREDAKCRAARARWAAEERQEKEDLERRREAWRSSYGPLQDACQKRSAEENAFAICQKKYDTTCNPKKIATLDSCVDEQVRAKGPTEQDARRLMQTEWDKRSKTGHSIRDSILD